MHSLREALENAGIQVLDLTDDATAKLHIRHLVGAPELSVSNFPNAPVPGWLFSNRMSRNWNISSSITTTMAQTIGACWWAYGLQRAGLPRREGNRRV